jgi:hypothetical protein
MNGEIEIIFVSSEKQPERFYCTKCFYGENKDLLKVIPKPIGIKCLIGSIGYFERVFNDDYHKG